MSADSVYTVAAGTSQWKALEGFCRTYGGFSPRFRRDGLLVAAPGAGRRAADRHRRDQPILSCTLREDHYGVLTEVLVIDKTRNVSYSVQNRDMLDRGGQCRRVVYTPGQSTWAAMRYTGEYQIRQSREEELTIELGLAGVFPGVSRGHGPAGTGGHGPLRRVPGGRGGKHGLPGDGRGLYIDTEGADMRCGYRDR